MSSKRPCHYEYRRLTTPSTIRLLRIQCELVDQDIAAVIYHFDPPTIPPYIALSYFWGDPKPTRQIRVQEGSDSSEQYIYPLHENLWHFLDQIYKDGRFDLYLWTDCICLDQSYHGELNQQVARMGEIYSQAKQVIAWLGRDQQFQQQGLGKVEEKMAIIKGWIESKRPLPNHPELRSCGSSGMDARTRLAYFKIQSLPYWNRIWILQEVGLAKDVAITVGKQAITPEELQYVYYAEGAYRNWQHVWTSNRMLACDIKAASGRLPTWTLVSQSANFESSKRADRIYGLLGLFGNSTSLIAVDYDKSPIEVYWDSVFGLIEETYGQANDRRKLRYDEYLVSLKERLLDSKQPLAETLDQYAGSVRTSHQNAHLARITRRVARAAAAFGGVSKFGGISEFTSFRLDAGGPETSLEQHAVFIGFALAGLFPPSERTETEHHRSPWLCNTHHENTDHENSAEELLVGRFEDERILKVRGGRAQKYHERLAPGCQLELQDGEKLSLTLEIVAVGCRFRIHRKYLYCAIVEA